MIDFTTFRFSSYNCLLLLPVNLTTGFISLLSLSPAVAYRQALNFDKRFRGLKSGDKRSTAHAFKY